ncbi:PSP1 domain-containing protein [Neobacillus pocheonensis]|uniref:PSP1 C-terminal domain-containing protein n=1 Tax=Neobacillus pocheonensis TaxID=363869 RepID=UPI003D27CD7D
MKIMRWLIRLYPRSWRDRYQEEFIAMLEQYERPRITDILDILFGAVDAHIQYRMNNNNKVQTSSLKGGTASMQGDLDSDALDKAFAQKTFEEGIVKHELPMQYVDVEYAPSFVDQKTTLTFYFRADNRLDLKALCKDLGGVYKQRIQLKQVGRINPKPQEDSCTDTKQ